MLNLGVSLYSLQADYREHRYDLYNSLKELHKFGVKGIEVVPSQNFSGLVEEGVDLDFYKQWKEWMEEFDMTPTNMNLYDEPCVFKNRWFSEAERIGQLRHGLEIAAKLGFRTARLSVDYGLPNTPHLENSVRCCEEYGIIGSIEIHSPYSLKSNWAQAWFETIDKLGTKYAGIHPDAGIFRTAPVPLSVEAALRNGAKPEIVEMIKEEYAKAVQRRKETAEILQLPGEYRKTFGYGEEEIREKVLSMGGGETECRLIGRFSNDDPSWILEYSKYIVHFHGKFYELVPDGEGSWYEPSINYQGIVDALVACDYKGFISTEWEGMNLFREDGYEGEVPKGEDYVRRHHEMIRSMEKKAMQKLGK